MVERIKMQPGIYPGMSYDEYFKIDAVNNSLLWLMHEQSPAHVHHIMENPPAATDALRIGKAFHTRILEPDKFDAENMIIPSFALNTKEGKQDFRAFTTELALKKVITAAQADEMNEAKRGKRDLLQAALASSGQTILEQHELDTINAMYEALKLQPAYQYVQGGEAEVVCVWEDEATGVLCKAKLDYVQRDDCVLSDLKSSMAGDYANASPQKYSRAISTYGLYQQAAMYCDGWQAVTGDVCSFLFIVCEKEAPYAVVPYELGEMSFKAGRAAYRLGLQQYKQCVEADHWPTYNDGAVNFIEAMPYTLRDEGVGPHEVA